MAESFYVLLAETPDVAAADWTYRGQFRATAHASGPWHPSLQHAGPPSALLGRAIARLPGMPDPGYLARFCADILGPIPVGEVEVRARVRRPGGRICLAEAELIPAGQPRAAMRATAWWLRTLTAPLDLPPTPGQAPPAAGQPRELPAGWSSGYLESVEWRWVEGQFEQPGPATVWTRVLVPLVDGEELTPADRVLAVADSGSGISAVGNPQELVFVNTDLTVHLSRPPAGSEVWMRAVSVLDARGCGLATSVIGDESGSFGTGAQTLFVERRGN